MHSLILVFMEVLFAHHYLTARVLAVSSFFFSCYAKRKIVLRSTMTNDLRHKCSRFLKINENRKTFDFILSYDNLVLSEYQVVVSNRACKYRTPYFIRDKRKQSFELFVGEKRREWRQTWTGLEKGIARQ